MSSLVLQRLDYGNAMLAGIPSHLTKRMQSVLNSAARLVFFCVDVRLHHAAPRTVAFAEGAEADRVQAGRSGVCMSTLDGSAVPR